jgi:glycosyltransferase involved in cell wall biosynthesis
VEKIAESSHRVPTCEPTFITFVTRFSCIQFAMASISALIHTHNDERQLGRTLESLHATDEVVLVDHNSADKTAQLARRHGAKIIQAVPGVDDGAYVVDCRNDWVLLLRPNEIVTESLEASLLLWKKGKKQPDNLLGYAINVREQSNGGAETARKQMRLVNREKINFPGFAPAVPPDAPVLPGDIISFAAEE